MKNENNAGMLETERNRLIDLLTEELPVLRARIGLSQEDLSDMIGISRQTYSSIETKKRRMTWNTFLSMILIFDNNEKTKNLLEVLGAFPESLRDFLNVDKRTSQ